MRPTLTPARHVCQVNLELVFVVQAESKAQQLLGDLHSQVDALQSRLHEADAHERTFRAKLDNAEHEVCWHFGS